MTGLSVFASKTATNTGHPAVGLSVTVEDLAHSQGGYAALFFGGNVGIGTPAPGEKLEVAGNARVTGDLIAGRVLTHTWKIPVPDYVFEKGYRLQSLEEVDAYVQKNKHLPEVPSAKEIKEKGLDLTDMNLKLLKKVEEMTLHMIALDKNLKEQSRKNGELEAELKSLKSKVR
jgi:hypothetical protein